MPETAETPAETAVYTHGHHESVLRSHSWRTAENSAAYLLPHLKPHMRVLDLGCGPGTITADLAALVPQGHVTGIDASEEVLAKAAAEAERRGLANVDFTTGDGHALAYPDDTFCVAHAHQVLQHVGDPVGVLRELRRVVKPGGIVAVRDADYAAMTWYPEVPGLDDWLDLYERVARGNGGEPDAGRRLRAWAHEAGFTDVASTADTWCYAAPDEVAWWSGLWADRTLASAYAERATSGGHADAAGLEAISAAWREWGGSPDAWFGVLHGEILCRV
ncbi:2-heptaprenyl-1,4-naphthoquinone methyltransferase [Streptomyces sp. SPB78]|uniref:class I SAM-dependent methyltransferase n=1 Tax=Streptomyces sp. (strain SPB78) TaxID=591157 RepID=UPI0001B584D9|nr:methyltransferase domain-containing protein [Streptomyces sp. SPB78]EFL03559.1 2-heptaprenyl-1,4-naphthoquinone methyltransferase [Streptomyces sp. SPB78]